MVCISKHKADVKRKRLAGIIHLMPKIDSTIELVKKSLSKSERPVIAFSGGKDSLVVLEIVRAIRPDTIALFCNTGNEYPETVAYVRTFSEVVEVIPEKSFWQCVKEYGLPSLKMESKWGHGGACCFWLKEKPANDYYKNEETDLVFTGLTMAESHQRAMMLNHKGAYYLLKKGNYFKCHPIWNWSVQDVWDYITFKGLRYNPIYDMKIPRCGCRFCTAYISWKKTTSLYNEEDTHLLSRKQGFKLLKEF